jgi:6-phosphogluconate dehydrogenase (decarboxylating)
MEDSSLECTMYYTALTWIVNPITQTQMVVNEIENFCNPANSEINSGNSSIHDTIEWANFKYWRFHPGKCTNIDEQR